MVDIHTPLRNNPGYNVLCNNISKYLDDSAVSKGLADELTDAKQNLLDAKHYYFQQLTLYTSLQEILLENNYGLNDQQYEDQKADNQFYKLLSDTLSSTQSKHCLNISMKPTSLKNENIFGLSPQDFMLDTSKKKALQQNIQQVCISKLENCLKRKSLELLKFWNPAVQDSEGLALAKANQLTGTITSEKKKVNIYKYSLKREEQKYNDYFHTNYEKILISLQEVENKMKSYKETATAETTEITADWLDAKCDTILAKIRVMKNHLQSETYTNENGEALQKVRSYLDREIFQTQNELRKTKQSLAAYESVGDSFKQMLSQYTQLTVQIDNKKWALTELKKNKQTSDVFNTN